MTTFFKMMKYELKRVFRNKAVFVMLICFAVILFLGLSAVNVDTKSYPLAIYTDGVQLDEVQVMDLVEEHLQLERVTFVDSQEKGLDLIKRGKVCFFICLQAGEEIENTTATFYYDQTSTVGRTIKNKLSETKSQYAYDTLNSILDEYGVKLKENYFQLVSFAPASDREVNIKQMPFAMEVAICVSIILTLGLAYSMSRDNETNVSKNLTYMPVGVNRYLLSKVVPYFLLGVAQLVVLFAMGGLLFKIDFETNVLIMIVLSSSFVLAAIGLSLIFSMFKSQIATIFLGMLTVVLPMFVMTMIYIQASPIIAQVLLHCFPVVPIVSIINAMMFNGVILWWQVGVLLIQSIVYYLIAMLILKRRVKE